MSRRARRTRSSAPAPLPDALQQQMTCMRETVATRLFELLEAVRQHPGDTEFAEQAVAQIADSWALALLSAVQAAADARQVSVAANLMQAPPAQQ